MILTYLTNWVTLICHLELNSQSLFQHAVSDQRSPAEPPFPKAAPPLFSPPDSVRTYITAAQNAPSPNELEMESDETFLI